MPTNRRFLSCSLLLVAATFLACGVRAQGIAPGGYAQPQSAPVPATQAAAGPFDENALRSFVSQQVAGAAGDTVSRFDVRIGSLDAQAQLAPCRRAEPFVPAGARLWGRSSLGLRCIDGAGWTVLIPITVTAWGRAVVAAAPLMAGTVVAPQDLREQDIELTRESANVLRDAQQAAGRTLGRALAPGQPLRADMLRVTQVVNPGDQVRLRVQGPGYSVAATGQALSGAGEGQSVRVKTELGKIVTGTAREGRMVDLMF